MCGLTLWPWLICRGQEEGVGRKEKSPDIFLEIIMWNQHFLKTLFYSKGVYSTDVSSDILWVSVISVLDIWITILDNAKPS